MPKSNSVMTGMTTLSASFIAPTPRGPDRLASGAEDSMVSGSFQFWKIEPGMCAPDAHRLAISFRNALRRPGMLKPLVLICYGTDQSWGHFYSRRRVVILLERAWSPKRPNTTFVAVEPRRQHEAFSFRGELCCVGRLDLRGGRVCTSFRAVAVRYS